MRTPRKRYQFKFWLDELKTDECELGRRLIELRGIKKFFPTIRDALTLLFSLQERRTDILFSMFPWIVDELKPKSGGGGDSGGGAVKEQLARLEQLILAQSINPPLAASNPKPLSMGGLQSMGAPKALNVPKVAAPSLDLDDDDFVLDLKKDTSKKDVSANFVNSILGL